MKSRKVVQRAVVAALLVWCFGLKAQSWAMDWHEYKARFISQDGRVIDFQQRSISHSEGQAYGMLLALFNGDKAGFEKIWAWTRANLQMRKGDRLFCWSWGKRPNGQWQVIDYNDASDGDILIGWALYLAWKKWNKAEFRQEAMEIVSSIRKELLLYKNGNYLLLPGYFGFAKRDGLTMNPSYFILSAFHDFGALDRPAFWAKVESSARSLLKRFLLGEWALPPDWITVKEGEAGIEPDSRGVSFGYDAWRTFLYAAWAREPCLKRGFEKLYQFFQKNGYLPRKVQMTSGWVSLEPAPAGSYACLGAYARFLGKRDCAQRLFQMADRKMAREGENYFSASLYLLAKSVSMP